MPLPERKEIRQRLPDSGRIRSPMGVQVVQRVQQDAQKISGRTTTYRRSRERWEKPKDQQPQHTFNGEGGYLTKGKGWGKLTGHSSGGGQRGSVPVDQGAPLPSKPITCYNCGKPGHIRRDCTEAKVKLGRISSGSETDEFSDLLRVGTINGKPCRLLIDTEADKTAVPAWLIEPFQYTGKETQARLADREIRHLKTAIVDLRVDGITESMEVLVVGKDAHKILLGRDHPVVKAWITGRSVLYQANSSPIALAAMTRTQSQAVEEEERENAVADARDGAIPRAVIPDYPMPDLGLEQSDAEIDGMKADEVSSKEGAITEDPSASMEEGWIGEDEVEGVASELVVHDVLEGSEGRLQSDQPLSNLTKGTGEVRELIAQQQADGLLGGLRKCAEKGEDGYFTKNGVLVHSKMSDVGKEWLRVVVPSDRTQQVLDVAHKGLAGGHFSHNKMVASLQPHFTWPGIRKDARQYCRTCPECQKAGRHLKQKAPMATTPIISVPYERLACDLVGPA